MPEFTDKDILVSSQYKSADNLNVRKYLHNTYSTNKYGWTKWLFDQLRMPDGCRALELGCGTGGIWKDNLGRIKNSWEVVLTDISAGMLSSARENIKLPNFSFIQADATNLQFDDSSFDIILADHMLYHVPDREKAIYDDSLIITEAKPLVDYVLSLRDFCNITSILTSERLKDFYNYINGLLEKNGCIHITKETGVFIAYQP